jgi:hypothetical protein
VQAEKQVIAAVAAARDFDKSRLTQNNPGTALEVCEPAASQFEGDDNNSTGHEDPFVVYVLCDRKAAVKYCMHNPDSTYAACSCNTAEQGSVCKHQIAWLLAEFPFGDRAERLIVSMLGTRLGFAGGCGMENISDLTAELRLLQIADMQCTHAAPCSGTNASELQGAEGAEGVDADAAFNQENDGGGAETWVPGAQAYDNHRCRMERIVLQQLDAIKSADPLRQKDLMIQQESAQISLLHVLEAAGMHPADTHPTENFSITGDGTYLRKRSCLEVGRKASSNLANNQQNSLKRPRQEFANTQIRKDKDCISKAFRGGRGAKQAATHVQTFLNHNDVAGSQMASNRRQVTLGGSTDIIAPAAGQSSMPENLPSLAQPNPVLLRRTLQPSSEHYGQRVHEGDKQCADGSQAPSQLWPNQRQQQQSQWPFAPFTLPREPLQLLEQYMHHQDITRLNLAARSGNAVPRSSLAFPHSLYGQSRP